MRKLGVAHDSFTFPLVNRAISSLDSHFGFGEMIHCLGLQMGFRFDVFFCNTLIELYISYGSICAARRVFDEMPCRDLVSWTSMISGYVQERDISFSFRLLSEMRMELEPNSVTVVIMLQACSISESVIAGRGVHGYVIKKGFIAYASVQNSLLTMYDKTSSLKDIEILFGEIVKRDVISWNIMISSYSLRGDFSRVAESFYQMQVELMPSLETLTSVISGLARSGNLTHGAKMHCFAIKAGLCDSILNASLVDFYAKCGEMEISTKLFREMPQKNRITWSIMMSGLVQNAYFEEAIELFQEMQLTGLKPGDAMVRSLVLAYSHLGALRFGKVVHCYVMRNILYSLDEDNVPMETSILNMYTKCGCITSARRCFDQMVIKDVIAWSSMIEGYGIHGLGFEALKLFYQMEKEGIKPNNVTFLSLLSACSHSGLLIEGCRIFSHMKGRYDIEPDLNHYTCMVDLLGRSSKLQEALAIILKMVVESDSRIWGALLAASRVHLDNKLAAYVAQKLLELEPDNTGYHILLGNIHASGKRWAETEALRNVLKEKDLKKKPGWSCVEAEGELHGFVAGDRLHCKAIDVYEMLGCLSRNIHEFGSIS